MGADQWAIGGGVVMMIRRWWLGAALVALAGAAPADVYKYVDADGNVLFSDQPLAARHLRLEWKRTARVLVAENREQSAAVRRERDEAARRMQARLHPDQGIYGARPAAPMSPSMAVRRGRYHALIDAAARRNGLPPNLLHAVIRTESAYQPNALSHAGACGLMQLMPGTARRFNVADIWDPAENIRGGATYLRLLLDLFDDDLRLALAAYNAGEGAVKKYGNQIPPYRETQDYVRKVMQHLVVERSPMNS